MRVHSCNFFFSVCCSSLFTNSNWFAFQDEKMGDAPMSVTSPSEKMGEINLNGTSNGGNSSSDDEVVVGGDEDLVDNENSNNGTSISNRNPFIEENVISDIGWGESGSGVVVNPILDYENDPSVNVPGSLDTPAGPSLSPVSMGDSVSNSNGTSSTNTTSDGALPCPVEEDVEFVRVELESSEKAMDQALKEGTVGEAGPIKKQIIPEREKENPDDIGGESTDFNDSNYWRIDQELSVSE